MTSSSQMMFDYKSAANKVGLSQELLRRYENAARQEFINDEMLFELHVLRAVNEHAASTLTQRAISA
jgi:hypothetical protein